MRKELFCAVALLAGSQVVWAQQWPAAPMNAYYPPAPGYGGYPAGWGMPRPMPAYPTYPAYPAYAPPTYPAYPQAMSPMYRPVAVMPRPGYYYPNGSPAYPRPYPYPNGVGMVSAGPYPAMTAAPGPAPGAAPAPRVAPVPAPAAPPKAPPAAAPQQLPPPKETAQLPEKTGFFHLDLGSYFHLGPTENPRAQCCWASADYMMAWVRQGPLGVPLVTTGSAVDTPAAAIGQPGTGVLFGNSPLNFPMSSGFRMEAGLFLDDQSRFSLDVGGFYLPPNHVTFSVLSDGSGNPIIARPAFFVVAPPFSATPGPQEGRLLDSFPGTFAGGAAVDAKTSLFGAEANGRYHFYTGKLHGSGLFGFRTMRLVEDLDIRDSVVPLVADTLTFQNAFVEPPSALVDEDKFRTINQFYGLQMGAQAAWEEDWWYVGAFGKVALGVIDQQMQISGSTSVIGADGSVMQSTSGGVLAQPSNIGNRERSVFSFLPELGLNLGLEPIKHVRLLAGYSVLFLPHVVRPGSLIDRNLNPFEVPSETGYGQGTGPARPSFVFNEQLFWMQALTIGLQFYY